MVRRLLGEGIDVQLTVRGAAQETVEEVKERLSNIAGREVVVKPFSIDRNEILTDMRQADVMVMPSQAEGFGLVGLEAAGLGLPVLLPTTSGVGAFFGDPGRFPPPPPPEVTRLSLVEQGFEDHVNIPRWTEKLREILLDIPEARKNALSLQRLLREANTTWVGAAESLAAALQAIPDRSAPRPQAPALPQMSGDGWANCAHAHWGRFGAAGLLPVHRATDGRVSVLMHHRGADTDEGGTWALLEGARDSHESAAANAIRQAVKGNDLDPAHVHVERVIRDDHGGWSYDTVIVSVDRQAPVRPVEGESVALAWVPLSEVHKLNLHPGFATSWPSVQAELDAVLNGESSTTDVAAASTPRTSALPLPAHPVTGARVVTREVLGHGDGIANRELATFDDGTRAVYEKYARTEDARIKVLDAHVGRAVGARVPLSHPVGLREVYTDHMPGEPISARYQNLTELANQRMPATRDGVFLGLHYALTATHGVAVDQLVLGGQQSLIAIGDGAASHSPVPDTANPFVRTFYQQVEPHVFSWVNNPIAPGDIEIMRRQLDGLRPLFGQLGRPELHTAVMDRFGQVAKHATGTDPLLPRPPGKDVTLPDPTPDRHPPLPPPPGSQERIDHQRIAEALLTDDGRITDTSQAKTIAIQAIAERMQSSTPELVLAAFGLVVGTDMGHRLGDARYVLVPHQEQYPSIGADVLHVNELDPANPRHAPSKVVRMDDPRAENLIRWIAVSELMGSWAYGSNNNVRALALQEATKEEFGLTRVLQWQMDPDSRDGVDRELDYSRDALRDFVRTQYEMTQAVLARRGITEVIAYRALTWQEGAAQPDWASLNIGDTFEARQRPLASWSADRQIVADWLHKRGGRAVILAARKPARDVLSIPTTGIGFFAQREWVTVPGDSLVTLDGVFTGNAAAATAEQTAASSVTLGAPDLDHPAQTPANDSAERPTALREADGPPLTVTTQLDPADPLDNRIIRVLDGEEEFPRWWPRHDSDYAITKRDLDFLGINPVQVKWMLTGEAPMGMTPAHYQRFCTEMLDALQHDGIEPSQVDIRLKGTGASFFSGIHKTLPREEDLVGNPAAAELLQEWFGDSQDRPLRRPYDAMWRLGLDPEPSDFDLDINSTAMVRAARAHWRAHHFNRYASEFMGGHGYLDKQTVRGTLPALAEWANRWERTLGRPLSLGVFESSGPFDATVLGRPLSSHFRDTDWIIHSPETPVAWRTPRSKITDRLNSQSQAPQPGPAAQPEGKLRKEPTPGQQKTDPVEAQAAAAAEQPQAAAPAALPETVCSGEPLPYGSRDDATAASRNVALSFQEWIRTPMGEHLANSEHPRVAAFRDAWQQLPPADLPAGPGSAAGPYREVAERAKAVAEASVAGGRFDADDIAALRAVAENAETHAARLSVSLPPSGTTSTPTPAASQQVRASRPGVAAPAPPAAPRGPRRGV
ncbi:hypothetical protein GCM10012280_62970 [Wenjunlia tyrosinilytica]|uniref:Glycosyltransferase n=1 Tax=Wenjunlia tyrosinilytica TaxID=1544741 RepID=A0A917ZYD4_9ACTN|nr:glycosyltransferase [Wenjunlia tyrosinilytica]GGO98557.1 hypothetical protein GCM10012280_62970 [Wenjunlia tyrosinilytica]